MVEWQVMSGHAKPLASACKTLPFSPESSYFNFVWNMLVMIIATLLISTILGDNGKKVFELFCYPLFKLGQQCMVF